MATTARPGKARTDRRHARHAATRQEIVDAAWAIARTDGIGALTMRGLARAVGMEPQSLYTYFTSKNDVYDAMFAEGNQELLRRMTSAEWPAEPRAMLRLLADIMLRFDAEDPARAQLLFQRTVPDFEPSPESYALAEEVLAYGIARLESAAVTAPLHVDLFTALIAGLATQQSANEPGGDRWLRLVDEAVDMFLAHLMKGRPSR